MTTRFEHPEGVHFRHAFTSVKIHRWQFGAVMLLIVTLPAWVVIDWFRQADSAMGVLAALVSAVSAFDAIDVATLLSFVLLVIGPVLFAWRMHVAVRDASLVVHERGLSCRPPHASLLLRRLPAGGRPWQVGWRQIQRVELVRPALMQAGPAAAAHYRLRVVGSGGEREVAPFLWVREDGPDHRPELPWYGILRGRGWRDFELSDAETVAARVREAPLVRELAERGVQVDEVRQQTQGVERAVVDGVERLSRYNLMEHKGLAAQLTIALVAGGYAFIDGLLLQHFTPLVGIPWWLLVVLALAALSVIAASSRSAPRVERGVVGALCLATVVAAGYPGMLRVNALTAEPVVADYTQTAPGRFAPPADRADLPEIRLDYIEIEEYWEHVAGQPHEFRLYRGVGDFWQLDIMDFYSRTGDFYDRLEE